MKSIAFMYECRSLSLKLWSGLLSGDGEPWQWPTPEPNLCVEELFIIVIINISPPKISLSYLSSKVYCDLHISTPAVHSFESNIPHAITVFLKYRHLRKSINEIPKTVLISQSNFLLLRLRNERRSKFSSLGL